MGVDAVEAEELRVVEKELREAARGDAIRNSLGDGGLVFVCGVMFKVQV